jgi:hypothetical protein
MVQVLRTARPTARKTHHCDLCGGPINPGETYSRQTNIYDARVYDWLTCPACAPVMTAVWAWLGSPWDESVGTDEADEWARTPGTSASRRPERRRCSSAGSRSRPG